MTAPAALAAALEDLWRTLASAPWITDPLAAEKSRQSADLRLRELAHSLDPESWPRAVRTYLWRHPDSGHRDRGQ